MLKLQELTFTGIGRFAKEQVVNLSNRSNLVQVNGKNLNTGGSSGSGKSTVFHALDYLFGINDIPTTALQNRKQKDTIRVSCILDNGETFRVERSKKGGLKIFKICGSTEEPVVTGSSKVAEEELDKILGLPRELVAKLVHKKQSEGGFFLGLKPKEVYDFLAKCLNLQSYNVKIVELNEMSKSFEKEKDCVGQEIKSNQMLLEGIKGFISNLVLPHCDYSDDDRIVVQKKILELENSLKTNKELLDRRLEELNKSKPEMVSIGSDLSHLNELKQELKANTEELNFEIMSGSDLKIKMVKKKNELSLQLQSINRLKQDNEKIEKEIVVLEATVEHLKKSSCPTCKQTWVGESLANEILKKQQEIEFKTNKIRENSLLLEQTSDLEQTILKLDTIINNNSENQKVTKLKEIVESLQQKINQEELKIREIENDNTKMFSLKWNDWNNLVDREKKYFETANIPIKQEIEKEKTNLMFITSEISSYNKSCDHYSKETERLVKQECEIQAKIKERSNKIKDLDKKINTYSEAGRCIKGYLLNVFQESLDYIGNKATATLSNVPHTSNAVVHFETGKENKDGTIREEITAYVNLERDSNIPICTLCGGERSAIDLAIDLAVNDLIEMRSGRGFDWVVLDEPFGGLDSIGKEACLGVLTEQSNNRRIIMVDHGSELKELINDIIVVERNGEESIIQW